jgi:hypothetical protein
MTQCVILQAEASEDDTGWQPHDSTVHISQISEFTNKFLKEAN